MKMKLFTLVLLAGGSLFAEGHWSIGIGIGTPYYAPPPPPAVTYEPPCPGPEYTWVPGYYYPIGARIAFRFVSGVCEQSNVDGCSGGAANFLISVKCSVLSVQWFGH